MSTGHRQEFIDEHMNDSNWYKMTRIGERKSLVLCRPCLSRNTAVALARKWQTACEKVGPAIRAFDDLTQNTAPEKVKAWTELAENAARERHNDYDVQVIYDVQSLKRKPYHPIHLNLL